MRTSLAVLLPLVAASLGWGQDSPQEPIRLHPDNPHYFLWKGEPTILITSGEHYGAVLNKAFDYGTYLKTLEEEGFNLTRTFSGAYCEPAGAFKIKDNTLAPARDQFICPWARSDEGGYPNGGNKFDLTRWDDRYFDRLRDFVAQAGRRGVVVELVLFCPFYQDEMWRLSPMNAANNVNGVGKVERNQAYDLNNAELLAVQEKMVRKIVNELRGFDNLYYEICNEPYQRRVPLDWEQHIASVITDAERDFAFKHLIAQNIANKTKKVENPTPQVSILNFHYAKPPTAVTDNYGLNLAIGDDETGFAGNEPKPYRIEAWDFLMAGGAVFSNLDYSFSVGHEDGTAKIDAPGGGGAALREQLRILKRFIEGLDFVKMRPGEKVIRSVTPESAMARALVQPGKAYALYVQGSDKVSLVLDLAKGRYLAEWVNTKTGQVDRRERFGHEGGPRGLDSPAYVDDVALRIREITARPKR